MQFIFYGLMLLTDGWLVFDLIIITLSWAFAQVQIIRAFRIFRAFRLITRIKVMKNLVLGTSSMRVTIRKKTCLCGSPDLYTFVISISTV